MTVQALYPQGVDLDQLGGLAAGRRDHASSPSNPAK